MRSERNYNIIKFKRTTMSPQNKKLKSPLYMAIPKITISQHLRNQPEARTSEPRPVLCTQTSVPPPDRTTGVWGRLPATWPAGLYPPPYSGTAGCGISGTGRCHRGHSWAGDYTVTGPVIWMIRITWHH